MHLFHHKLQALVAADRVFGSTINKRGYKVIQGCGVIQGDGIDIEVMKKVAGAIEAAGYSAENVTYGMGGGLLQKVMQGYKQGVCSQGSLILPEVAMHCQQTSGLGGTHLDQVCCGRHMLHLATRRHRCPALHFCR